MANFDTMENGSSISYADDAKRVVVEWHEVTLRDNRQGFFEEKIFKKIFSRPVYLPSPSLA